ncbi:MAG: (Fe-S)-binding protein [Proteobacteria bacterium]|nr:(Fe-S)-binding protein [Desulfobacula sp.]MBU3951241.1 (Fe-S)-binding protein [Pseudomonadota bacterium]MBU4132980.1 (Fe-S)-binding protein [Pseudomonadota bacterium]
MNPPIKPLKNCGKCGLCLTACPVYKVLKEEQASPRAKLQLIKAFENNTLESSPLLKELVSKCLMCGSCAVACPSGINHYEHFMDMRQKMVESLGETPAIKSLIFLLSKESRIRMGAGMAKLGQTLTPKWLADKYRLGNIPINQFPRLNPTPFRKTVATTISPKGLKKGSLVYFTGCATNFLYEDTGISTIGILTHLGYEVIIPKDQTCCGIPLMFHGAPAVENMMTNIQALCAHDCHGIIVDCTTCGAALKDEYPALIRKTKEKDRPATEHNGEVLEDCAQKIAAKTTDILSFIAAHRKDLVFDETTPKLGPVAYHAPCHSRNSFKSQPLVQDLLRNLPFMDYTPTPDEAECCGGGGTFFYEHPDIAKIMMDKKLWHVNAVNARYWLTDCPVCRINMSGNLDKSGDIQVRHPVSLIYGALKKP